MMEGISAVALFCEDIRRETTGRTTIIGMMADTSLVPEFPWTYRRLAVYLRVRFDVHGTYDKPLLMGLEATEADIENKTTEAAPQDAINRAILNARKRGLPYATISGRIQIEEPVVIPAPVIFRAVLRYGDEKIICGILNVTGRSALPASDRPSEPSLPDPTSRLREEG
jgi:hypothetical protein